MNVRALFFQELLYYVQLVVRSIPGGINKDYRTMAKAFSKITAPEKVPSINIPLSIFLVTSDKWSALLPYL